MKKNLYAIVIAVAFFTILTTASFYDAFAQSPDGSHCSGQPIGDMLVQRYEGGPFPGSGDIFGIGAANISSFGPRGSVLYRIRPHNQSDWIENMPLISDSLTLTLNGITEVIWAADPEQTAPAVYGSAIRYNGPTEVESMIWINATPDNDLRILRTSQISTSGKYSVHATIGDKLYGLRSGGGNYGHGVFFSIDEDGTDYTELYHFHGEYERPDKLMLRYEFNSEGPDLNNPDVFWGISYSGGSHGKGALLELAIDGSYVYTKLDFTGQGGPDDLGGPTDGEGPVAILQDIDTDAYVITRSGGAHNKGAIFLIGLDGTYKVHDFTAQYGTPTSSAMVDPISKKVFGISGDVAGNDGYVYAFNLINDFAFNEHLIDFNTNEYGKPVSLGPLNGKLYIAVAQGNIPNEGSLISADQDGSNITHVAVYENCTAVVTNPSDNATHVPLTPTLRTSRYSTWTNFQLSEEPDFSDEIISLSVDQEYTVKVTTPLKPGTKYYARVDLDISFPGPVTSFTTAVNNLVTYIKDPLSGATEVSTNPLIKLANISGATSYTVEVSEHSDFSSGTITKTSTTPDVRITGPLKYSTVYYARAKSNASPEYSYVTQFTTHGPEKYCFVSNPAHQAFPVATNDLKVTANLVNGATTYTIEISSNYDFSNSIVKTSAVPGQRTMTFTGLSPFTQYYNRVKTNLSPEWGPTRWFVTAQEPSYVTQPGNNKTNVSLTPIIKVKEVTNPGVYTLQLSTSPDFSTNVTSYESASSTFSQYSVVLVYSTTYYARVKTTGSEFGQVTSFTTHAPELYSFVSNPVNGATNVAYQNLQVTANQIAYAVTYTIELNTNADFTGTSIVKQSAIPLQRTLTFDLMPSTTYYNRTRTDVSGWGPTRSFTTAPALSAPPAFQEHVLGISASPNPFNTTFTVQSSPEVSAKTFVSLIDATGRVLHRQELESGQNLELGEGLASGLYILRLEQGTTTQIHRMIKSR
jgi:hypothetical protein